MTMVMKSNNSIKKKRLNALLSLDSNVFYVHVKYPSKLTTLAEFFLL